MEYGTSKRTGAFVFVAMAAIFATGIQAQAGDPATLIQEKLISQIKLTKATSSHDDIVTAGDVVVLHKDGLVMCSFDSSYAASNHYSNGVLTPDLNNRGKDAARRGGESLACKINPLLCGDGGSLAQAVNNSCKQRKFVAGEKFWVTDIEARKDGILVSTLSDPYNDVRYYGEIKFPFPKGAVPPVDEFVKTVSEVITVQPSDDKDTGSQSDRASETTAKVPPPTAPAPAPMEPIAPPPPVDARPPTIAIGQTVDQVTAGFGQPGEIAKPSSTTEIYIYKDLEVTFTNGKVSKIESR
jgi:hypothetical protein